MDPVTAVGLAAAILQLVEFGSKVVKRLHEISAAGDIPKVFRDVRTRLPLILQIVERTRDGVHELNPAAQVSVDYVVRNCYEHVESLQGILDKLAVGQSDSRWKKGAKAVASLTKEDRVLRIASALKNNVQLLTSLNVTPSDKKDQSKDTERRSSVVSPPPSYQSAVIHFTVPWERDSHFVGRSAELEDISKRFSQQQRVAITGIGGVGKSQIAIEFCYRHRESHPSSHVFWVWGGNEVRFRQGYKRIAQVMDLPGWDDPDVDILQLVHGWLSHPLTPYLLVIDNADDMKEWWPAKYASKALEDNIPSADLSQYLPDCGDRARVLITTRDARIASRLAKQGKPISVQLMSTQDSRKVFLSKYSNEDDEFTNKEVDILVQQLDNIPLAISQAAAFLQENDHFTIAEYLAALETDEAEHFLQEELHDTRRDQDSINSIFKTWKLSCDQIQKEKPRAMDLLLLLAMFDRQSVHKSLILNGVVFQNMELATSLTTLHSFNLIGQKGNKTSFQLHRLVHRFVQSHANRRGETEKWRAIALRCVSKSYPVEIGPAQHELCESLTPHVLKLIHYQYSDKDARIDLAVLLCWSADFEVEKNEFALALSRAKQSLDLFEQLVPENDERRACATWLYGRLLYYQACSDEDMAHAAEVLETAYRISAPPNFTHIESQFELAHLYFDKGNEKLSLKWGLGCYEGWKALESPDSQRTLDVLHDYALELALFGHVEEAIEKWNEILERYPASTDSSEDTKKVYELRSLANIAEFSGDAPMAEILFRQLIELCGIIYNEHHVHIFDYRLCLSEQILRQGRWAEAAEHALDILASCQHSSEWQIRASSLRTIAECCRQQGKIDEEEGHRKAEVSLHESELSRSREETIAAIEEYAHCVTRAQKPEVASPLWEEIVSW